MKNTATTQQTQSWIVQILPMTLFAVLASCSAGNQGSMQSDLGPSQNIVNGTAVLSDDPVAQSTVALYLKFPTGGSVVQFCSGTLIGKKTVLTAAHCMQSVANGVGVPIENLLPFIKVGFGLPIAGFYTDSKVQFADVSGVNVNPDFAMEKLIGLNAKSVIPDVALIQLTNEAPARFKPAKLLTEDSKLTKGSQVILAGYGLTQAVPAPVEATELRQVAVTIEDPKFDETQFAYLAVDGKGSCSGDSGGPAFVQDPESKELFVAGITSFGDKECVLVGVYTSVPAVLSWIQKHYDNLESGKAPIPETPTPSVTAPEEKPKEVPAPTTPEVPKEQPAPTFT